MVAAAAAAAPPRLPAKLPAAGRSACAAPLTDEAQAPSPPPGLQLLVAWARCRSTATLTAAWDRCVPHPAALSGRHGASDHPGCRGTHQPACKPRQLQTLRWPHPRADLTHPAQSVATSYTSCNNLLSFYWRVATAACWGAAGVPSCALLARAAAVARPPRPRAGSPSPQPGRRSVWALQAFFLVSAGVAAATSTVHTLRSSLWAQSAICAALGVFQCNRAWMEVQADGSVSAPLAGESWAAG